MYLSKHFLDLSDHENHLRMFSDTESQALRDRLWLRVLVSVGTCGSHEFGNLSYGFCIWRKSYHAEKQIPKNLLKIISTYCCDGRRVGTKSTKEKKKNQTTSHCSLCIKDTVRPCDTSPASQRTGGLYGDKAVTRMEKRTKQKQMEYGKGGLYFPQVIVRFSADPLQQHQY